MKYKRQGQIIKIIKEKHIKTHEQLINELNKAGFDVTQATISRDIKELGLVKTPVQNYGAVYSVPDFAEGGTEGKTDMFGEAVISIECALHTVVIKTYPGMAQAVAASVDSFMKNDFLGSVAGDDTVLIIAANADAAVSVNSKLQKIFKTKRG